jgi:hypothetical protein
MNLTIKTSLSFISTARFNALGLSTVSTKYLLFSSLALADYHPFLIEFTFSSDLQTLEDFLQL